ncbi:MAG: methyltransferase [Myxococcota bacterium]
MTMPLVLFAALLAATGLMRLGELAVSLRRMRARPEAVVDEAWLFPLMAVLHAGVVALPLAEVVLLERLFSPAIALAAAMLLALATALRVWTLASIGPAWNVRVVIPQADAISTRGPYRWIRHPNYLVVILELAALPMVHTAWISALVLGALNGFVLTHRIRTEEAMLARIPAWSAAMAGRKRLIPGVF